MQKGATCGLHMGNIWATYWLFIKAASLGRGIRQEESYIVKNEITHANACILHTRLRTYRVLDASLACFQNIYRTYLVEAMRSMVSLGLRLAKEVMVKFTK